MERDTGVEPVPSAWKANVLPLYESRLNEIVELMNNFNCFIAKNQLVLFPKQTVVK